MIEQDSVMDEAIGAEHGITSPDAIRGGMDVSLMDFLMQLAYRKWLIAKVTGFAMLVGLVLCFALPVKYTATTRIMTPQQPSSSAALLNQISASGASPLAALAGGGLSSLKDPNTLYIGLLTSRPVADAIIHRFSLDKVYRARNMTAARLKLAGKTKVISEKTGFIALSFTDTDKKNVAGIANAYTDELRNLMKTLAVTEASQRRLFYEEQLKQAKETLVQAELSFIQVQQKRGLVQPDVQASAMIQGIAALRAKVAAQEVQVQALRSYSTDQNPEVQLAERELTSLQAEAAQMEQQSHTSGFGDMSLADVPGAGLDYLRAERELKYRQVLFDLLIKQYDAAKLDEAKSGALIQVVEPAIEPDQKTSPKRAFILVSSTFAGFLIGCILALLLWWYEQVQTNSDQAAQLRELKTALLGPNQKRV